MKASVTLALAALVAAGPALADPPGHAPAHGYHKKHRDHDHKQHKKARHYKGKSGVA